MFFINETSSLVLNIAYVIFEVEIRNTVYESKNYSKVVLKRHKNYI
jgi:hypothetical protein